MALDHTVYLLEHLREHEGEVEVKTISIYSSKDNAKEAIERLASQPGFQKSPDGFTIDQYTLDEDNWAEGFVPVNSPSHPRDG